MCAYMMRNRISFSFVYMYVNKCVKLLISVVYLEIFPANPPTDNCVLLDNCKQNLTTAILKKFLIPG